MSSTVAIRRAFLEFATRLAFGRGTYSEIVCAVKSMEAVLNTMAQKPVRLLLVSEAEAKTAQEALGVEL